MKPESAKRIIDAYVDIFEELSIRTFKQGFAFVVDTFEKRLNTLKQVRTRDALQAMLLKEPEPDPVALDAQVEAIRRLPYTFRMAMPAAMREFAQTLPHDPGGRPRTLTDQESRYVCEEIGKLYAKGVTLRDAQHRLARRMCEKKGNEVSLRTVQRAWQDRARWFDVETENTKGLGKRIAEKLRDRLRGSD